MNWTPEQQKAVTSRDTNILVSANAGSGKSVVLVGRIMDFLINDKRNIDEFLIITYTNAAAAELRAKIIRQIGAYIRENPTDKHMARQMTRVFNANISTVHAFCMTVLRQHSHLLGLAPDFTLLNQQDADELAFQVLDDIIEQAYAQPDNQPLLELVQAVSDFRSDVGMVNTVFDLFLAATSSPFPEKWLEDCAREYQIDPGTDIFGTTWGKYLKTVIKTRLDFAKTGIEAALDISANEPKPSAIYLLDQARFLALEQAIDDGFDAFYNCVRSNGNFDRMVVLKNHFDPDTEAYLKDLRDGYKGIWAKISALAGAENRVLAEEICGQAPVIQTLVRITLDFKAAFDKKKRDKNALSFSDLEHLAVKLLVEDFDKAQNRVTKTRLAEELSLGFCQVMVDEYQDTNLVQDVLFRAVSDGKNLFVVGDVKQSIDRKSVV